MWLCSCNRAVINLAKFLLLELMDILNIEVLFLQTFHVMLRSHYEKWRVSFLYWCLLLFALLLNCISSMYFYFPGMLTQLMTPLNLYYKISLRWINCGFECNFRLVKVNLLYISICWLDIHIFEYMMPECTCMPQD